MTHHRGPSIADASNASDLMATVEAALGVAASLARDGRLVDAIEVLRPHLQRAPDSWPLASAHADLLEATGATGAAIDSLCEFTARSPDAADAWYRLAGLLSRARQSGPAIQAARAAVTLRTEWPQARNRLGCLLETSAPDGALVEFGRAVELAPDWNVPRLNLARLLRERGQSAAAMVLLREAVRRRPGETSAHVALAEVLLERGDFAEGWRDYEWRFDCGGQTPAHPGTQKPVWDGQRLEGQIVMVWLEQGIGDHLQFCRYLPCIVAQGGRVWLQAPRVLQPLLRSSGVVERFVDEGEVPEGFDLQIPLLSLPHALRASVPEIPAPHVYLSTDTTLSAAAAALLSTRPGTLRVGLVFASRPDHPTAARRDCPLPLLGCLAGVPDVRLFSLQFGPAGAAARQQDWPLVDLGPVLGDFAHTAAIVLALDLVITVDTAMAHLCGAIGHPVWTLLSTPCDWRWQFSGRDSAWYPSMRLYRQAARGDWSAPLEQVGRDLAALAVARAGGPT